VTCDRALFIGLAHMWRPRRAPCRPEGPRRP
jgi:hypothetical protein